MLKVLTGMTKASLTAVALAGVCRPQRGSSIAAGGDVNNDAERDVVVSQRPPGDDAVYRLWSSFSRDPVVPQRDPDDTAPGPKELVIVPGD